MMIADQCRAIACRQFAASLDPWASLGKRARLAAEAEHHEAMADALDAVCLSTATGEDLFALGATAGVAL